MKSLINISLLSIAAVVCLGASNCAEPKEFCKIYKTKADLKACSEFCEKDKSINGSELLIQACEVGQNFFLSRPDKDAAEALRSCEQSNAYSSKAVKIACKEGVNAEAGRFAAYQKNNPGTAQERETGNRCASSGQGSQCSPPPSKDKQQF